MIRGLFVTGTDTGVGKTVVSAALLHRYRTSIPLRYWKPIQTGIEQDDDTAEVLRLVPNAEALHKGIRLPCPVSPHLAARWANHPINLGSLQVALPGGNWIVEGAGGLLVPVNDTETMADWMAMLNLPIVVVARTALGTINHTLLTLEALRARALTIAGVVMVGEPNQDNHEAIEYYGEARILGTLPPLNPLAPESLAACAAQLDPGSTLLDYFT